MSDEDRLGVYAITPLVPGGDFHPGERRLIAQTSLSGLGLCLLTLTEDGEFESEDGPRPRVGVYDAETRQWLVNPWAGTSLWV